MWLDVMILIHGNINSNPMVIIAALECSTGSLVIRQSSGEYDSIKYKDLIISVRLGEPQGQLAWYKNL